MENKDKIKLEVMSTPPFLNTYYDEEARERKPRKIQIARMTVTCAACGLPYEMNIAEKGIDILRDHEIWVGNCTHCFVTNLFQFRVMLERTRVPSDAVIAKRKAKAEGKELKVEGWVDDGK